MALTSFMNLTLPDPTVTIGPTWATELNQALTDVDAHDHTSGKGVKVKAAGLDINANLDIKNNKLFDMFSTQYKSGTVALTGASNANSLSVTNGNLFYVNEAGTSIQLTAAGAPSAAPGTITSFALKSISATLTILPGDTFVYIIVDTTSARIINLPAVAAVSAGRIYIIKDKDGLAATNNITVNRAGLDLIDGATSLTIDSNNSTTWVVSDGISNWFIS